jgi:hypothetical protein
LTVLHKNAPTLKTLVLDSCRFLDEYLEHENTADPALSMVHLKLVGKDLKNKLASFFFINATFWVVNLIRRYDSPG